MGSVTSDYKSIAAEAQKRRDDAISSFYPNLPDFTESELPNNLTEWARSSKFYTTEELEIIESEAEDILQKIRDKIWTSLEVTKAFCKASALAQKLTNCVTEVLYPEAIARAKELDEHLEKTGDVVGPLHGLPISLKDCFVTPPHPASIGMAEYGNEPTRPEQETLLVTVLRKLGAVFYIKSNVPTAMMMMETINNIWGETRNPLHKGLSPGGSSGGESALVAFKASPLGVGTDIGGSIRIPSAWGNLYGLKPSFGRFPVWGAKSGIPGQQFILAINGPMSRSLESVKLYCEAVLSPTIAPWDLDIKCLPIPWRKDVIQPKGRKLRFGIVGPHDGIVTCHPPLERALSDVSKALTKAGHEVVEWQPIGHKEILETLLEAFHLFGAEPIISLQQKHGEPIYPAMAPYETYAKEGGDLSPTKMRTMNMKRDMMHKAYLDRWQATATADKPPLDGIIMPTTPWCASRLGTTQKKPMYVGYTGVFNLLDFSVCTFPVTTADKSKDKKRDSLWNPLNEMDKDIQEDYDPEFYHGAPVALQLIGKRLEEEKVLEMTEIVADLLKEVK